MQLDNTAPHRSGAGWVRFVPHPRHEGRPRPPAYTAREVMDKLSINYGKFYALLRVHGIKPWMPGRVPRYHLAEFRAALDKEKSDAA